jgi:MFS family permease
VAVLAVTLLVVSVGNTILNVALPNDPTELDAGSSELQWIVDGYLLVFAGLLLTAATLGDRFGRRRALTAGLVAFALGSVLAAVSDSSDELIASRAPMGVGWVGRPGTRDACVGDRRLTAEFTRTRSCRPRPPSP